MLGNYIMRCGTGLISAPTIAVRLASVLGQLQDFLVGKGDGQSPENFQRWTHSVRDRSVYKVSASAPPLEITLGQMNRPPPGGHWLRALQLFASISDVQATRGVWGWLAIDTGLEGKNK